MTNRFSAGEAAEESREEMRSAAIRDVNFNLGEDCDGGGGGDEGGGGGDEGVLIRHERARGHSCDLDHISSLRLRQNPPTDYSRGRDSEL